MRKRLLLLSLTISLAGLIIFSLVSADIYYKNTVDSFEDTLKVYMNVYEEGITPDARGALKMSERLEGARVTFLNTDGSVIADTDGEEASVAFTEEVISAINKGEGFAVRNDGSLNKNTAYYCRKYGDVLVRISLPTPSQWSVLGNSIPTLIWLMLLDAVICVAFSFLFTGFILRPLEKMTKEAAKDGNNSILPEYSELKPLADIINDMNEQMEEKIRRLDEDAKMQALLLNSMEHGIIIWDSDNRVRLINDAAARITGGALSEEEINSIASEGDAYKAISNREYLFRISQKGSSKVLLITDVTDIRRAEKSKNDFIANVTHEMNTPLTSIKGFAELIGSGELKEEKIKSASGIIISQSEKLASLIKSIINYSEIDSDDLPPYEINLTEMVVESLKVFEPQLMEKNITLVTDLAPNVKIMSRYERMNEILSNLVSNAVRYNVQGGEIKVMLTAKALTVSDTGVGISEQNISRIFDRFYTVDKSHSGKGGGFGLGLAIVKKLCAKAGYGLNVESKESVGTTFTVTF